MITPLTRTNFDDFLQGPEVIVVYFWAEWCQPCHAVGQAIQQVATAYPNVKFGSIDTEAEA